MSLFLGWLARLCFWLGARLMTASLWQELEENDRLITIVALERHILGEDSNAAE